MVEYFINYFSNGEFIKDIFLIAFGAMISLLSVKFNTKIKLLKIKKGIESTGVNFSKSGIISLVNSYPSLHKENIHLFNSGETYKLSLPNSQYVKTVSVDNLFDGNVTFEEMGNTMNILEFEKLVSKHKKKVEDEFRKRKESGRPWFNNEKFGIRTVEITKTDDSFEHDIITLYFYKTDYFTHKVMRSIYHELQEKGHNIADFSRVEDVEFDKYYPFLTSFGIDSLLIVRNSKKIPYIFLAKRSKYLNNMNTDLWHVSMNEGLSITDLDVDNENIISLDRCVNRGYREELGIKNLYRINKNEYKDLFMTKDNFEMGITTIAEVDISVEDLKTCYKGAEDSSLETVEYKLIPYSSNEIKKFLQSNESTTEVLRYCLTMTLSKMI